MLILVLTHVKELFFKSQGPISSKYHQVSRWIVNSLFWESCAFGSIWTDKHTYIHTYIHTHIHTYIHTYIHIHTCIHRYSEISFVVPSKLIYFGFSRRYYTYLTKPFTPFVFRDSRQCGRHQWQILVAGGDVETCQMRWMPKTALWVCKGKFSKDNTRTRIIHYQKNSQDVISIPYTCNQN